MTVLVLGGKGYIATAYGVELEARGVPHRVLSRAEIDYADRSELRRAIRETKADFLINAAGYTGKPNVDAAETDRANCIFGNAVLPGYVREVCEDLKLDWGQISSGCIYDGYKEDGSGYTEEDVPNFSFRTNNCSFYSGTKALGEEVLSDAENCYIWRIRIPFNHEASPRNYLTKLISYDWLLDARNSISHLNETVNATLACREKEVPFGKYNVTNPGSVTTRDVVGWMLEESERRKSEGLPNPFDREYQFFESTEEFLSKAAATPRSNCVMNSTKLQAAGVIMKPVEESVRDALRNWTEEGA